MSQNRFLIVGLTGSLSSGKSVVRRTLELHGCLSIDADQISREITAAGSEPLRKIIERWGEGVLHEDGNLDRRKLAELVFKDARETNILNEITHPFIINRENEIIENIKKTTSGGIIVVEAALMIETGSYKRFDLIVVITCTEKKAAQLALQNKKISPDMFKMITARQLPDDEKKKYADYVIENNGSLEELTEKAEMLFFELYSKLEEKMDNWHVRS